MNQFDSQYVDLIDRILREGIETEDRTGTGTLKVFSHDMCIDLRRDAGRYSLPALTLRKVFPRVAFEEMKWMLSGSTDVNILKEKNVHIWDGNSSREFLDARGLQHLQEGHIGKGYGYQFRSFNGHYDQLKSVMEGIKRDPNGRRHYISLWNPTEMDEMALPPCHLSYQFMVTGEYLNLKFYKRSSDAILGLPTNALFSTFFLTYVANALGYKVGELAVSICDAHIYLNHVEAAMSLLEAKSFPMASFMWDDPISFDPEYLTADILSMDWESVDLEYTSNPAMSKELLKMSV